MPIPGSRPYIQSAKPSWMAAKARTPVASHDLSLKVSVPVWPKSEVV